MIQADKVTKRFGDFTALKDLSCKIPQGCIYGLVGSNGAGKSTFLRLVTGVYRADRGMLRIDGENVYENPAVKSRVVFVPDDLYFLPQGSMNRMAKLYATAYSNFSFERYRSMTETFGLDPTRNLVTFSKGMRRQAATILALACMPDYLFFDETFDGLDPVMRRQIWSIILSEVAEKEMTVLVSSHNLRELEDVCDHVGIMHHGKIMIERSLSDLQGSVSKIQVACQSGMPKLPEHFQVLHMANTGRVYTMIVKGDPKEAEAALSYCNPTIVDVLPLTLEEIFIYEMGGADYEVKDILF